jgi:hypothetical protein
MSREVRGEVRGSSNSILKVPGDRGTTTKESSIEPEKESEKENRRMWYGPFG